MGLAPFFDRIYSAIGGHLSVSRDDLEASLSGVAVGIVITSSPNSNETWIAEFATNLMARLYPRISIRGPQELVSVLRGLTSEINPEIEFVNDSPSEFTLGVGIGASGASLFPSASGWVSLLDHSMAQQSGPANPYASAAAASFAASELFRRIFLKGAPEKDFSVSLLNFDASAGLRSEMASSSIGDVLFVAVGAVGNAAVWALSRDSGRTGHLTLLDYEEVELSNLQRYVLGTIRDVGVQKVELARRSLQSSALSCDGIVSNLESFADERKGLKFETICISVDNVASRRASQALLPKLLINGWTGELALGASWHVFSREAACLACLYQPQGEGLSQTEQAAQALGLTSARAALLWVTRTPLTDEDIAAAAQKLGIVSSNLEAWRGKTLGELYTDVVCGAVPINLPVSNRVETVPLAHQSALAGILMATELVKRTSVDLAGLAQQETLVSWDDVLRQPPEIWNKPRAKECGCICGDEDYQKVYREKWEIIPDRRPRD